jgi:hypothetical protein
LIAGFVNWPDDHVDSISQALGHEIKASRWDDKSLDALNNFYEGIATELYYRWATSQPR